MHRATPALVLLLSLNAGLLAQPENTTPPTPSTTTPPAARPLPLANEHSLGGWTVRLLPRAWYAAPAGDLTLPGAAPDKLPLVGDGGGGGGGAEVDLGDLGADEPELSPEFNLSLRVPGDPAKPWGHADFWSHGWEFTVAASFYSGDHDGVGPAGGLTIGGLTIAQGDPIRTSVDWSTYSFEIGKWIAGSDFDSGGETRIDLTALTGIRVHSQDVEVVSGGTAQASETFFAAVAGLRLDVKLPADFVASVELKGNYFPGDAGLVGYEIAPSFTWRPTDHLGLQIGYRLLGASVENGDEGDPDYYKLDGSLAGLFAGVEVRF